MATIFDSAWEWRQPIRAHHITRSALMEIFEHICPWLIVGVSGLAFFEQLANQNFEGAGVVIRDWFDWVSKGEFKLLQDLRDAGYTDGDVIECLRESVHGSLWVPQPDPECHSTNGYLPSLVGKPGLLDYHLPHCMHRGSQEINPASA